MPKRIRSFEVLGRLTDMNLDQLRVKLSELQGRRTLVNDKISRLKESEQLESLVAAKYPVESFTFPAFGAHMRQTLDQLQYEIKQLDSQISDCLEDVRYHFQESKKMELARKKEVTREQKQQQKQEQSFYDQIAENRHQRTKVFD